MAVSYDLKVYLGNSFGDEKRITLKEPETDELTLAQVREAFKPALDSDVILSSTNNPYKEVSKAVVIQTTTTEIN